MLFYSRRGLGGPDLMHSPSPGVLTVATISSIVFLWVGRTIGHEAMATAVRQSAYFQHLPELPVSCRQFDGDASNIPIIFEDVYIPLTVVSFLVIALYIF